MENFVTIVNPANGRKGRVAATSKAAAAYRQPPSEQIVDVTQPHRETAVNLQPPLEVPAGNASTEGWRTYATDPRNPNALSSDRAAEMSRDEIAAHYKSEED